MLFLIRHAKSSWAQTGLADHDRPLAERGHRQVKRMGSVVDAAGAFDASVFCSTAKRARQTFDGLVAELDRPRVAFDPALYTFDWRELVDWLSGRSEHSLTLIGHNPALEDLAAHLLGAPVRHLPTCGFVHLQLRTESGWRLARGVANLKQWTTPKMVHQRIHMES